MHTSERVGPLADDDAVNLAYDRHRRGDCYQVDWDCAHCRAWDAAAARGEGNGQCATCAFWRTLHCSGDGNDYCKRHYPNPAANL